MKHLAIAFLAIATICAQLTYGYDQDIAKLNRFVQNKSNTASMQIFREGRDFIEAQNWQRAAEKFNDFITGYPKDKDLDAALYWYGYALQKQNRTDDAANALLRLIRRFPNSNWRNDAQALLVVMGRKAEVEQAIQADNCEIKMLALQSLFQADQERAIMIATESLRTNSSQCPGFPAAAVSMLGSQGGARAVPLLLDIARGNPDMKLRLTAIKRLGEQRSDEITDELIKLYDMDRNKDIRIQVLRALVGSRTPRGSAKVLEVARAGDDLAVRQYALRYIGELKDAGSLEELIRIYDADKTPEIRSQILRTLAERDEARAREKLLQIASQGETPERRLEAIRRLGGHGRIALDDLIKLYTAETNLQIKQGLLRAFAESNDPRALAKLFDIARSGESIELRGYAIRRLGEKDDEQTVNQLVAMYDTEKEPQVRVVLMRAFGDSKQKSALRKLMTIARNDPSVEQRKVAIMFLGQSKDPEALKFLEDFLK